MTDQPVGAVERLRAVLQRGPWGDPPAVTIDAADLRSLLSEREALIAETHQLGDALTAERERLAEAEAVIAPFADAAAGLTDDCPDDDVVRDTDGLTVADLRRAADFAAAPDSGRGG